MLNSRYPYLLILRIGLLLSLCACGVLNQQNSASRWLTQAQILENWVRDSETELMTPPPGKNGDANFWLIPKGYQPEDKEIYHRIMNFFGGSNTAIRYTMSTHDVDLECLSDVSSAFPAAFPVTSFGLELEIQVLFHTPLRAENIFMISEGATKEYQGEEIPKLGWSDLGNNKFRFKIPENTTGAPKLWCIRLYYTDRASYDNITRSKLETDHNKWYKNKRWAIGPIYLLQVTDSLNPHDLYPPILTTYINLLPDPVKWLPDPEGGYAY